MRIRQLIDISGTIDGAEWPGRGEELTVADHVAADLIANGYAEAVSAKATKVETASADPVTETAAAPKPRARRTKE